MLDLDEVLKLYAGEMIKRGVDIGDPKAELDQIDWDSLYALYLKGVEDGKKED